MTPDGPGFNSPSKPAMEQYSGSKSSAVFTDDQLAIRDLTRRFVRSEILRNIWQWDEEEAVPADVWKRIGELGLHGVCAPAQWGGSDSGIVAWALMVEELAYGDCAIANQVGGISFPYVAKLLQFGTEKQKEKFLRPVVEGKYYVALLLTEPHAGSDLSSLRTRAVRKGDRWIINGHKVFITGGSSAGAANLLAYSEPGFGKNGVTNFLGPPNVPGHPCVRWGNK